MAEFQVIKIKVESWKGIVFLFLLLVECIASGSRYIDDCGVDLNGKIKSTFDEFTGKGKLIKNEANGQAGC